MTMSSAVSKVTLNGDGVQTSFPFSFKVWKAADLEISITNAEGATTVVSNWSVSLAGQGGTVTYPTSGPALPSGHKITIARSMDFLQDVDLVSGARWDPEVVETALDIACAERQQLKEEVGRAIKLDISDPTTPAALLNSIFDARDTAVDNAASALDSAERAEAASTTVAYYNHEGTLPAGQSAISLPWAYDTTVGVEVYLSGVKQTESSLIFTDAYTVTLDAAVTADTPFEVVASAGARGDLENKLAAPTGSAAIGHTTGTVKDALDARPTSAELAASGGSAAIGFVQSGTGAVARTAQAKARERITPFDFGAVGDGVADDAAKLQLAINALGTGQALDGLGATFRADSGLTLKANMTLQNITLDFSNAGNSAVGLLAVGSMGAYTNVSGTVTAGVDNVTVASAAGLAAGDYVYLKSANLWDDWDDFVTFGEVHRILSVVGTSVTFHDHVLYTMTGCSLAKINTLDDITLRDVRAVGSGVGAAGDQEGASFIYCRNLLLDNCEFIKFDDRSVRLNRCIDFEVRGGAYGQAQKTGLSYGLALGDCCTRGIIHGCHFYKTRHGVTLGDTEGPNRFIVIDSCTAAECADAGLDAHTAADHCVVSNNVIYCDPANTNSHGILWRSANVNITNNRIVTPGGNGIFIRDNMTGINTGDLNVTGNTIIGCNGTYGILYQKTYRGNRLLLNFSNNTIIGNSVADSCGIAISSDSLEANHRIQGVVVSNNILREFVGSVILINARHASAIITEIVIANNALRGNAARGIYLVAATAGYINNIVVTGNVLAGTMTTGVKGTNDQNLVITGNYLRSATTKTSYSATNVVDANNLI